MYVQKHEVNLTTDASGDAVRYTPVVNGRVLCIRYLKTDFADGVDFDVELETSGVVVWSEDNVNASKTVCPRQTTHSTAGEEGTEVDGIFVAEERIKITVASGGNAKSGKFIVMVG